MDYFYIEEWIESQPLLKFYTELGWDTSKIIEFMSEEQKTQYLQYWIREVGLALSLEELENELYNEMSNLNLCSKSEKKLVLYSGSCDGKDIWKLLEIGLNGTKYLLASKTPIAYYLNKVSIQNELNSYIEPINITNLFSKYATRAYSTENTIALTIDVESTSVWASVELPTLFELDDVKMIDGIDKIFLSMDNAIECIEAVSKEVFEKELETISKEQKEETEDKEVDYSPFIKKLDEVSKLKEFSEYGLDEKKILGSNGILDSDEAVDLYFTKRDGSKLCLAA